jgi:peptidoglycan/LPS O-acetylase OafA/YrhL
MSTLEHYQSNAIKRYDYIDGLRCVAVLSVVFFHFGYNVFSGGFLGVDIFFVISGFLITKILVSEINRGEFSLISFYERRVRRILPALNVVILFCLIVFPPFFSNAYNEYLGLSAITTSTYTRNILALYIDSHREFMDPLIHTWSLSVEEQFYIFFPVLLFFLLKNFGKTALITSIFVLIVFSLANCIYMDFNQLTNTTSAFSTHLRVWQLGLGALIAVVPEYSIKHKDISETLSFFGICIIIISVIGLDTNENKIQVSSSIFACVGTALMLYVGIKEHTITNKVLSLKPIVGIGLLSYSLYLWHWPMFILASKLSWTVKNDLLQPFIYPSAILLALIFSFLSWKFVEEPIRQKCDKLSTKKVFLCALFISLLFISWGMLFLIIY